MPRFDTGKTYDSVQKYDQSDPPPKKPPRMASIRRNWSRLNRQARVDAAKLVHTNLTGNTDVPSPMPTLAALQTVITAAQTAIDEVAALEQTLKIKRAERDAKVDAVVAALGQEASTVEAVTNGDPTKMLGAGFEIAESGGAPVGDLPAPEDVRVTAGDNDGEVDVAWDSLRGAGSYEQQTNTDPNASTGWVARGTSTRSSTTLSGLTSGVRIWVRVRGIGAAGAGAWSDPTGRMVP